MNVVLQERAEGVSGLAALHSDALLQPLPIVYRVIRLDGRDHTQSRESFEIPRSHVLCVLDAEAAVCWTSRASDVLKHIEHSRDRRVTDGMHTELQSGAIGALQSFEHLLRRLHLVAEQAARVRRIDVGLE